MKNKRILLPLLLASLISCGGSNGPSEEVSSTPSIDISSDIISSLDVSSSEEIKSSEEHNYSSESFETPIISSEDISSEIVPEVTPLNSPSLIINEENGVVTWNEVEGATHYNYIINDSEVKSTTSTTLELLDRSTISIQAANNETISSWSYPVTYFDTSDIIIEETESYWVYFHNTSLPSVEIKAGDLLTKPNNPSKIHHTFDNWYEDPYHTTLFDFSKPITKNTIIYANYFENELIKDTYFWVKANPKISATISGNTSDSGWNFIPLKLNKEQTKFKEFYTTVTVHGATSSDPAAYLIMDGFDNNPGRTYWKNGNADFTINSDGIYNIYFTVESQYAKNIHAKCELTNNTFIKNANTVINETTLNTPIVSIDSENDLAIWDKIPGAKEYEVVINNNDTKRISDNYISLNKKDFITVRAISPNGNSNWSIPNANLNYIYEDLNPETHAYVYFINSSLPSVKIEIGASIEALDPIEIEDYTFEGWYEDIALTKKAEFPYTILKNTVFYPKYTYEYDYKTKDYYNLVDEYGNKVCGLKWNIDNYDFLEYTTNAVKLNASTKYYVQTLDGSKSWGPYIVSSTNVYKIYFSEDNLWNVNTEFECNVYITLDKFTLYFSNNQRWSGKIYAYTWNSSTSKYAKAWPGNEMTYVKTNDYGEDIYKIDIDITNYDCIIFNNGSNQSKDISLDSIESGTGFFISDNSKGYGTYKFM